jgi:hypothetical protein
MSNLAPSLRDTGPQRPAPITGAGDRAARHFIHGNEMKEGKLNRVSAVVRAYEPCLSCSTHADGTLAQEIALKGSGGEVPDRIVGPPHPSVKMAEVNESTVDLFPGPGCLIRIYAPKSEEKECICRTDLRRC